MLPIIAIIVAAIAAGVSGYALWATQLKPFKVDVEVGSPILSLVQYREGSELYSLGMALPIDMVNTGARGGTVKDMLIKVDTEGEEYPFWFLQPTFFASEYSAKMLKEEFREAVHPIYVKGGERIYRNIIFIPVTGRKSFPIFRLSKPKIPIRTYTLTLFLLDSSSSEFRPVKKLSFNLVKETLTDIPHHPFAPYILESVGARERFFQSYGLKTYDVDSTVILSIIPKPLEGSCTVIIPKNVPAFTGEGDVNYICGNCGALIAEKISRGQITNAVVLCPQCGQYNEFP